MKQFLDNVPLKVGDPIRTGTDKQKVGRVVAIGTSSGVDTLNPYGLFDVLIDNQVFPFMRYELAYDYTVDIVELLKIFPNQNRQFDLIQEDYDIISKVVPRLREAFYLHPVQQARRAKKNRLKRSIMKLSENMHTLFEEWKKV